MLRIKVVMNKNILRRKIKIKRDTREGTKINSSIFFYTQTKTTLYQTMMMIVTMIQKEYSLWKYKMMNKILKILKNKVNSISKKN
jgi:hypothetical protein